MRVVLFLAVIILTIATFGCGSRDQVTQKSKKEKTAVSNQEKQPHAAYNKRLADAHKRIKGWLSAREKVKLFSRRDQMSAMQSLIEEYKTTICHDVDYVIQHAPHSDPRREACIKLREIMTEVGFHPQH
jgi:uncharacterized protein YeeX (DUF496 family)